MSRPIGPKRESLTVPITALAFLTTSRGETLVLVGEDTQLRVYGLHAEEETTTTPRWEVRVFAEQQSLHGIAVQDDGRSILVWGGREVAVLPVSVIENDEAAAAEGVVIGAKAPDWIYDGKISPVGDGSSGVLVTAHNEVVEISWHDGKRIVFGNVSSPSRPILYAADLRYLADDNSVLVAGGTVFGEILVWRCNPRSGSCEMLHVFTGHEGSIFGVHLSDEIKTGDGESKRRLLASCSDDRTVRIWEVSESLVPEARSSVAVPAAARETGFGRNHVPGEEENRCDVPLAMAMGHVSRIWHVKFPPNVGTVGGRPVPVYSFGEDSTAQLWHLDLVAKTLVHQETFSNHEGKHLWSSALARASDGRLLVATGGADGRVSLIEERESPRQNEDAISHSDIGSAVIVSHETLPLLELGESGRKKGMAYDFLHRYSFVTNDSLLATTSFGKVLLGTFGPHLTWSEIPADDEARDDIRLCSVIANLGKGSALLGTNTKALYLFHNGTISKLGPALGKVLHIIVLDREGDKVKVLVTMHDHPDTKIYTIDLDTRSISSETALQGMDPRFVLASAALIRSILILGSRHGYMSIFRVQDDTYTFSKAIGPRSPDAINAITPLPGQDPSSDTVAFLTSNRDGKYRIYELDISGPEIKVFLRHETSPPFGPLIENAWFVKREAGQPSELILAGFKGKSFVVWNETTREMIMSVDCGGAHRTFAHTRNEEVAEHVRFASTKASKLYIHSQNRPTCRAIKAGTHGREIRAIASMAEPLKPSSSHPSSPAQPTHYIATGSEDTTVRIWDMSSSPLPPRCAASIKVHTTGLQSLKWCGSGGEYLISSGGNEDLFVFRVRKLAADFAGLAVFCEAAFPDKSVEGDLRITDFDVGMDREEESGGGGSGGCLVVTMGFSNSVIKRYRYTPPERRRIVVEGRDDGESSDGILLPRSWPVEGAFELLVKVQYTGACITQVRHLDSSSSLLTASTDGHIAMWDTRHGEFVLQRVIKAHQSSIKSMSLVPAAANHISSLPWLVATAGDDNAVAFTAFGTRPGGDRKVVVENAHAAAINGVSELGRGRFVTVSNDQRVKVWEVSSISADAAGEGGLQVRLLRDVWSGVADAGPVEPLPGGQVVVGGVGMEIWDMVIDSVE